MSSDTWPGLIKRNFIVGGGGGCFKPDTDKMSPLTLLSI